MSKFAWVAVVVLAACGGGSTGPDRGACCLLDGTCYRTTASGCASSIGTFHPRQTCAEVACEGATRAELGDLAEALELLLRDDHEAYIDPVSIVAREYWDLNGIDPERTGALLGRNGESLSPTSEIVTRNFLAQYRIIQRAAFLIRATENSSAGLSAEEENSLFGYAKTFQAHSLLLVLNQQSLNGILPLEALDDPSPGDFLGYVASLQYIADLLDEAATLLTNGGSAFIFTMTPGFDGFSTPATFRQFNRALSARVRAYQEDSAGSISGIAGSFFNINGDLSTGPRIFYDTAVRNPFYNERDIDLMTAHPTFEIDALLGDLSVPAHTTSYSAPVSFDGLMGSRQAYFVYSDLQTFPLITNLELILLYAEAQIGSDSNEVLAAVNKIRNANGLGNYLGALSDAALLDEVLRLRRYNLFGEGHRWVDLRRTGMLGDIPVDRPGDVVHPQFPRPAPEVIALIPLL